MTLVARTRHCYPFQFKFRSLYIHSTGVGVCGLTWTRSSAMDWAVLLLPVLATLAAIWLFSRQSPIQHRSAAVVVLGDIGRSPRIMYHAQSFALNGFETFVVGYKGNILLLVPLTHIESCIEAPVRSHRCSLFPVYASCTSLCLRHPLQSCHGVSFFFSPPSKSRSSFTLS